MNNKDVMDQPEIIQDYMNERRAEHMDGVGQLSADLPFPPFNSPKFISSPRNQHHYDATTFDLYA